MRQPARPGAGRLDGSDGVNGDTQIEGLQAAATDVAIGECLARLVQQAVEIADRLADQNGASVVQRLADRLATGDFADTGVAGAVLENEDVAGEVRTMGAAQVEQHAVLTCDRDHPKFGDDRSTLIHRIVHVLLSFVLMVRAAGTTIYLPWARPCPRHAATRTGCAAWSGTADQPI